MEALMPYRAVYTTKRSLCGDEYVEVSVVFDEVIDHVAEPMPTQDELVTGEELERLWRNGDTFGSGAPDGFSDDHPSVNSRILDPDWDTIPF
jgi:hypothetical protein